MVIKLIIRAEPSPLRFFTPKPRRKTILTVFVPSFQSFYFNSFLIQFICIILPYFHHRHYSFLLAVVYCFAILSSSSPLIFNYRLTNRTAAVKQILAIHLQHPPGDILVFMTGQVCVRPLTIVEINC